MVDRSQDAIATSQFDGSSSNSLSFNVLEVWHRYVRVVSAELEDGSEMRVGVRVREKSEC